MTRIRPGGGRSALLGHADDLNLHSSGRRLGMVAKLTSTTLPVHASASTELADFVLPAIEIGDRPFEIRFRDGVFSHSAAATSTVIAIAFAVNNTLITNSNFFVHKPPADGFGDINIVFEHTLAPGTYEFSVFARTSAGVGTLNAFNAGRTTLSIVEL